MKPTHFKFQSFFLKADGAFCNHSFQTFLVIKIKFLDRQQQNYLKQYVTSGFDLYELVFVKDWNKPGILFMGIKAERFTKFQGILTCFQYKFYIDITTWPNLTKFCSLILAGASPRTPWWTLGCLKTQT